MKRMEEEMKKIFDKLSENKKYLLIFAVIWFGVYSRYAVLSGLMTVIEKTGIDKMTITIIGNILIQAILVIIMYILMKKELKYGFVELKNNFKEHFNKIIGVVLNLFLVSLITTTVVSLIVKEESLNNAMLAQFPMILQIILGVIAAPFVEELIFRGLLKKVIKSEKMFIVISSLLFGLIHVNYVSDIMQFIYIIPYGAMGIVLAQNYVKNNNIAQNILTHSIWNALSVLLGTLI